MFITCYILEDIERTYNNKDPNILGCIQDCNAPLTQSDYREGTLHRFGASNFTPTSILQIYIEKIRVISQIDHRHFG